MMPTETKKETQDEEKKRLMKAVNNATDQAKYDAATALGKFLCRQKK